MASILVVDDSIIIRKNLRSILNNGGHRVVAECADGMQAYLEYSRHKPDLVTMDITMPRVGGIEAIKKILSTFPQAKIIVISSVDQKNIIFASLQEGAKNYILKPFSEEKVLSVVNKVLGHKVVSLGIRD